jgi:hypothetical protein
VGPVPVAAASMRAGPGPAYALPVGAYPPFLRSDGGLCAVRMPGVVVHARGREHAGVRCCRVPSPSPFPAPPPPHHLFPCSPPAPRYPKFVVDFQLQERERIAAEESALQSRRRLAEELARRKCVLRGPNAAVHSCSCAQLRLCVSHLAIAHFLHYFVSLP